MKRREKNKELHQRLEAWGEWTTRPVNGIGYPGITMEGVMMEMGQVCRSGNRPQARVPQYNFNPKCTELDIIIETLPKEWKRVIHSKYAHRHKEREMMLYCQKKARRIYEDIEKAHVYICGKLGITYEP